MGTQLLKVSYTLSNSPSFNSQAKSNDASRAYSSLALNLFNICMVLKHDVPCAHYEIKEILNWNQRSKFLLDSIKK